MKKHKKFIIFILISLVILTAFTIADLPNDRKARIDFTYPSGGSSITNNTNSSNYWDNIDTPDDIVGSEYWYNMTTESGGDSIQYSFENENLTYEFNTTEETEQTMQLDYNDIIEGTRTDCISGDMSGNWVVASKEGYSCNSVAMPEATYIKFNLTDIPNNAYIVSANLSFYNIDAFNGIKINIGRMYPEHEWDGVTTITNNSKPCGEWDNNSKCDLDYINQVSVSSDTTWYHANITWLNDYLIQGRDSIVLVMRTDESQMHGAIQRRTQIASEEYSTASLRPYINITYKLQNKSCFVVKNNSANIFKICSDGTFTHKPVEYYDEYVNEEGDELLGDLGLSWHDIYDVGNLFARYIGSATRRVTKIWVNEIDGTGDFNTTGKVCDSFGCIGDISAGLQEIYENDKTDPHIYLDDGDNFTFQMNSTANIITEQYQTAEIYNLEDATTKPYNTGGSSTIEVSNYKGYSINGENIALTPYFMFNISDIPAGATITSASFHAYQTYATNTLNVGLREVLVRNWTETTLRNQTRPCYGIYANLTTACNNTDEGTAYFGLIDNIWLDWDITNLVSRNYNDGNKNISFMLRNVDSEIAGAIQRSGTITTKEYSTASLRPYINVSYYLSDYRSCFNIYNETNIINSYCSDGTSKGLSGNYSVGGCWQHFEYGIMTSTNCSSS